jgi:hypothetical protein
MKIEQRKWTNASGGGPVSAKANDHSRLALVFGATALLRDPALLEAVKKYFPGAHIMGCSTAGEICGTHVSDDSVVVTAIEFEHTQFRGAAVKLDKMEDSLRAGQELAGALPPSLPGAKSEPDEKLAHVFVLSDGLKVNGSDLVRGLTQHLPKDVTVTGGLAGDGARFSQTLVFWDSAPVADTVAVLGLYGSRLKVGFGSLGGWDPFGPERVITRAKGNVLYELDGQSALGLYKKYLGDQARGLPATGLLFPLSLRIQSSGTGVVRTILAVDEKEQSMTFAGDVPEGAYARLMKANFDRLIDGAVGAARTSHQAVGSGQAELAILISCVGRKLVLRQRIEEEVEGVRDVLGERAVLAGFYSYGEISPFTPGAKCELHNQTMTITTFLET